MIFTVRWPIVTCDDNDPGVPADGSHDQLLGHLALVAHHIEDEGDDFAKLGDVRAVGSLKSRLVERIPLQSPQILLVADTLDLAEARVIQGFQDLARALKITQLVFFSEIFK